MPLGGGRTSGEGTGSSLQPSKGCQEHCPSFLACSLTHSFSAQVLTVLCNVAEKGPAYCQQLHQRAALPLLLGPLALPDPEVVGQCLELLHLLFLHCPQVGWGFTPLNPV